MDQLDQVAGHERQLDEVLETPVHLAPLHAEPRAHDAAGLPQLAQNRLGDVDRDREADGLRLLRDERVDPDDAAAAVHEGPARVSGVDRRVRLDERLFREAGQEPVQPAHDAAGHRLLEADRVRVAEPRDLQRRPRLEADQRQVEQRVEAEEPGRRLPARVERDGERGRAVHDVRVGQHLAVALDHDARADDRLEAALRLRRVELRRLDRDDRRRDALEHGRERLAAGLRVGDAGGEE